MRWLIKIIYYINIVKKLVIVNKFNTCIERFSLNKVLLFVMNNMEFIVLTLYINILIKIETLW
jgi:hypothetical protein